MAGKKGQDLARTAEQMQQREQDMLAVELKVGDQVVLRYIQNGVGLKTTMATITDLDARGHADLKFQGGIVTGARRRTEPNTPLPTYEPDPDA